MHRSAPSHLVQPLADARVQTPTPSTSRSPGSCSGGRTGLAAASASGHFAGSPIPAPAIARAQQPAPSSSALLAPRYLLRLPHGSGHRFQAPRWLPVTCSDGRTGPATDAIPSAPLHHPIPAPADAQVRRPARFGDLHSKIDCCQLWPRPRRLSGGTGASAPPMRAYAMLQFAAPLLAVHVLPPAGARRTEGPAPYRIADCLCGDVIESAQSLHPVEIHVARTYQRQYEALTQRLSRHGYRSCYNVVSARVIR